MHLVLNYENARQLGQRYGVHTADAAAEFLGIDIEHARDVCERHGYPSDEFIAAVLAKLPVRFDDLFLVVYDTAVA